MMVSALIFAQKPVISFDKESYDFGQIEEANGVVTVDFNYTNTGKTPLVLHNVQASCGCTTPEWTRTPIQPGGKGIIKVTFNPANRPGSFSKTITVQSNAEKAVSTLRIVGNVLQKPKTIEDEYPIVYDGLLRATESHIALTNVAPNETKIGEMKVINVSDKAVKPEFINVPQHINVAAIPAEIQPGEKAIVQVVYDASKKNDWGFVTDQIYVTFNGERKYNNRLTVSASINEDFTNMTEAEKADAPVMEIDNKTFNFGEIGQTNKVEHDFVVTNKGKNNLIIRKVKASCGCTAVQPAKTVLTSGEQTTIHVTFDPRGKAGQQQKTVTVITNDPTQQNILLRIQGRILTPGSELKN